MKEVEAGRRSSSGVWQVEGAVITGSRNTVLRQWRVGWVIRVSNGRGWQEVKVTEARVGKPLGWYVPTRNRSKR